MTGRPKKKHGLDPTESSEQESKAPEFDDPESWEIFGLLLSFVSADIGIMRAQGVTKPPVSPKLVTAVFVLALQRDSITVSKLAEGLGVSLARASRVVDDLVKEGLLIRDRSEEDRRELQLRLTPVAMNLSNSLWDHRKIAIRRTLNEFSKQELGVVRRFFASIVNSYQSAAADLSNMRE